MIRRLRDIATPARGALVGLAILLAAAPGAARADFVIGTPDGSFGNSYPFSDLYAGPYQQVYSAGASPGAVDIIGLGFASTNITDLGDITMDLTVSLSTTSATPDNLSTDYVANRGADFTAVFSGTITFTPLSDGSFDFQIPTSLFHYDPSQGSLLVEVNTNSIDGFASFESTSDPSAPVTSRVYNFGGKGSPSFEPGYGLVTQIHTVPEPASLALLALGGSGLAWRSRRRPVGLS